MAKTIRVSDAVYQELQKRGTVFEDTPDRVLRRVLGLPEDDQGGGHSGAAATSGRQGQDVGLLALLNAGLLSAGDELAFARPRKGELHTATVTADGHLELADGRKFGSPSGAADACAEGVPQNGWAVWRVKDDGTPLSELRARFRGQR